MAPERITGQSYTITSDVWSLGVTLLEVAQHRFPFPADGTEMQPKAGLIDLLTYIVRQPIPKLKDEEENKIKWSEHFKYFIECWYVSPFAGRSYVSNNTWCANINIPYTQLGKGTGTPRDAVAHARTSLDGGNAEQESKHAALPSASLGLEGLTLGRGWEQQGLMASLSLCWEKREDDCISTWKNDVHVIDRQA